MKLENFFSQKELEEQKQKKAKKQRDKRKTYNEC
jgi:hypothetical protein